MTNASTSTTQMIQPGSLAKKALLGALPALALISLFLMGTGEPDPAWGKYWMLRPLIVVPVAGTAGGVFYYFMDLLSKRFGWNKVLVALLSLIVYITGIWLGTVLGLDGTYWN